MLKNKKGFTLIELLVVIAIIAMLLSIMMPALGKAKKIAQNVLCKANLHQWMYIWVLYTDDHDGKFPGGNVGGGQQNWYNLLADLYEDQADIRAVRERVGDLLSEVGYCILVDRNVINVCNTNASSLQAITDGHGRESGPVFISSESLLFNRSNKLAIAQNDC